MLDTGRANKHLHADMLKGVRLAVSVQPRAKLAVKWGRIKRELFSR
jgi:hypothetical protein